MPDDAKPIQPDKPAPRRWNPPARAKSNTLGWIAVGIATLLVVGIGMYMIYAIVPQPGPAGPPKLAAEFTDYKNDMAIAPPVGWQMDDRRERNTIFIKGPREDGFSPLLILCWEPHPGKLESYLKEHKGRIENDNKTVKWIDDSEDPGIDGCRTRRLEYECDWQDTDTSPVVRIRSLQFVLEDAPRFYRVTGFASAATFEKYKAAFELAARSFRRRPSATPPPAILH